ncbi:hypothetical protein [Streptomyces sp. LN785]
MDPVAESVEHRKYSCDMDKMVLRRESVWLTRSALRRRPSFT